VRRVYGDDGTESRSKSDVSYPVRRRTNIASKREQKKVDGEWLDEDCVEEYAG
jgi:hypothetical protein